jgi:hypothetical protein
MIEECRRIVPPLVAAADRCLACHVDPFASR